MSLHVLGVGTAVPPHHITQADAARIAADFCGQQKERQRLLSILYRRSGVRTRHSVVLESSDPAATVRQTFYPPARHEADGGPTTSERMLRYEVHAGPLAVSAARRALEASGRQTSDVTHLITVSCTGFAAPGIDVALIGELGLAPGVSRTHIGFMGCHGALNGLRVANALSAADPAASILLCAVELCSLHQQYGWNPDRIVANALFADGAAALVAGADPGGSRDHHRWFPLKLLASGSTIVGDSEEVMRWRIGDHGFQMTLSARVPDLILQHLRPWLRQWLAARDLTLEQIGSWAIHPGGPRILTACAETLGLCADQIATSKSVLADFGNMSSPTVLFILRRLRETQARLPCLMLGFGPGLAIEAALLGTHESMFSASEPPIPRS